jgi:hypothetical protein
MILAAVGLVVFVVGGCGQSGPKLCPVKGKVTYKGAAVAGASVTFVHPNGQIAVGQTDAQGAFALMTAGRPGVAAGDYKVGIAKMAAIEGAPANPKPEDMIKMMKGKSMPKPKSELPEKYASPEKSGFTANVTTDATKNNFTFDMTD